MAKYYKKEIVDLNGTGRTQAYYKMLIYRNMGTEEFIERCTHPGSGLTRSEVAAVLAQVSDELARQLADGYTVSIDGLGTFGARLGVREGKDQDAFEADEEKRNSCSLMVRGITYKADKRLVMATDACCRLESCGESRLKPSAYSAEERADMARSYLKEHGMMRVADYMKLTGLSRSEATRDLRRLRQQPESGIYTSGVRSSLVYLYRDPEERGV